jgi:hypothetical protein
MTEEIRRPSQAKLRSEVVMLPRGNKENARENWSAVGKRADPVISEQLARAGTRLATLLNQLWP